MDRNSMKMYAASELKDRSYGANPPWEHPDLEYSGRIPQGYPTLVCGEWKGFSRSNADGIAGPKVIEADDNMAVFQHDFVAATGGVDFGLGTVYYDSMGGVFLNVKPQGEGKRIVSVKSGCIA